MPESVSYRWVIVACAAAVLALVMGLMVNGLSVFCWLGHGLGGDQGGLFHGLTGSYLVSFAIAAAAGILNLMIPGTLLVLMRRRAASARCVPA